MKYTGSCHCKAVTFEVEEPASPEVERRGVNREQNAHKLAHKSRVETT